MLAINGLPDHIHIFIAMIPNCCLSDLVREIKKYAKNAKFYWCQEEPKNMGAWFSVRDYIQWTLDTIKANNSKISYIGRSPDASPATGYAKRHISQQQEIIKKVFE